jgi:hypothetical protein
VRPGVRHGSTVVPVVAGDEMLDGETFDLVKIDVQGAELDVIAGLGAMIRRSPHLAVIVEFNPGILHAQGVKPTSVLDMYRDFDFDVTVQVGDRIDRLDDHEIMAVAGTAGAEGQLNLVLQKR